MTDKVKEQGDQIQRQSEAKPLASPDAQAIATPSARDKQVAEADRTNQSSGSIAELALKSRGLTREQVAAQLEAQGDSVSIDYGNGLEASRKSGLTGKDLQQKTAEASEDQSKITFKPVEVTPEMIRAGLDYNMENQTLSQKLAKFATSAQARLLDQETREAYVQGLLDKTFGIGEGLNQAKDEIKTGFGGAADKAWTGLSDGSVAKFLAQPNAINEPLFRTTGNCLDVMSQDPHAVNKVLTILGRELENANDKYSRMSPRERGIQDGKAMFFFINPSGSTEAADLALAAGERVIAPVDKLLSETVKSSIQAAKELAQTSAEAAMQTKQMLFDYLQSKGYSGDRLRLVGVPDGYFDGMKPPEPLKPSDHMNAMSAADSSGGGLPEMSNPVDPEVQRYLERLPQRLRKTDKTSGIFVSGEHEMQFLSGYDGPTKALPMPAKGFNNVVKAHVEAHAAAFMRLYGLTHGRIYINNAEICDGCKQYLYKMLPNGGRLEVVLPDGKIENFVGGIK